MVNNWIWSGVCILENQMRRQTDQESDGEAGVVVSLYFRRPDDRRRHQSSVPVSPCTTNELSDTSCHLTRALIVLRPVSLSEVRFDKEIDKQDKVRAVNEAAGHEDAGGGATVR